MKIEMKYPFEISGWNFRRMSEEEEVGVGEGGGGCCSLGQPPPAPVKPSVGRAASWLADGFPPTGRNQRLTRPSNSPRKFHETACSEWASSWYSGRLFLEKKYFGKKNWQNRKGSLPSNWEEKFGEVAQTLLCFTKTTSPHHQLRPIGDTVVSPEEIYVYTQEIQERRSF